VKLQTMQQRLRPNKSPYPCAIEDSSPAVTYHLMQRGKHLITALL